MFAIKIIPLLLLPALAVGREMGTMTWEECLEEARRGNPDLASALAKVAQSRADRTVKMSPILPQVSATFNDERSGGTEVDTADSHRYHITASQLFFDGLKSAFETAQAGEIVEASRFGYSVTSSNVRFRLRSAFVNLMRAQESVRISGEILERRKQNNELVKLRYEAGREHRGSFLLAEADLAQAEYEVREAGRSVILGQRGLGKELGRAHMTPIEAHGSLDISELQREKPDLEKIVDDTPLLRQLVYFTRAARYGVKSTRGEFFPEISGDIGAGKAGESWPPDTDEWNIGFNINFPLFEGRRRVGNLAKAKGALTQAEADEKSGRDGIIFTLEDTWTGLCNAIEQVVVQRMNLNAAEERSKIGRAQYAAGLINFDDWTIIEDALVKAKKAYLDAQAAALRAEASWLQARGVTMEDRP